MDPPNGMDMGYFIGFIVFPIVLYGIIAIVVSFPISILITIFFRKQFWKTYIITSLVLFLTILLTILLALLIDLFRQFTRPYHYPFSNPSDPLPPFLLLPIRVQIKMPKWIPFIQYFISLQLQLQLFPQPYLSQSSSKNSFGKHISSHPWSFSYQDYQDYFLSCNLCTGSLFLQYSIWYPFIQYQFQLYLFPYPYLSQPPSKNSFGKHIKSHPWSFSYQDYQDYSLF